MLSVENLHYSYGAIKALNGISFKVDEGEIVALIGANGAGKSTTLSNISGILHPQQGSIKYRGTDISKLPPHKVVEAGISLVPEGRRVFSRMTVLENLEMGAYIRKSKAEVNESIENVFTRFERLKERRNQLAGTLSGGEQQMLAIGRALMSKPKLLLMDEPSMGLAPMLVQEIFSIIKEINDSGTTILLVEQNAYMALSVAQHAYVLETGAIALSGTAEEMANNPAVKKAYLGE
ncbi:ABC transporter ATP-binding protein [Desulfallas thermosapovorans]|uniref:Amino acid/amide ABC transporter ATP-binding protein 2 (HAAT family) n=1 Tax=Desulfallas thermosapovorans DSM 6562 TaxID=1121431 RepID=A0A5S4ZXW9_9FIRM|nr:ABC transporter ATP-binding protein [Desulfallas thermosapovorans]TYO97758.1 amino acid/amide ABC transporter ATP-binding protein 2 (HAAT family) [Desulfallas thermosapovorans DSM 6562]